MTKRSQVYHQNTNYREQLSCSRIQIDAFEDKLIAGWVEKLSKTIILLN